MRLLVAVLAACLFPFGTAAAAPQGFDCRVHEPISAAALNTGGTWSFEAFNGTPGGTYSARIQWAADPSNGGHANGGVGPLDANGYGITTLGAYWQPDGTVPGYFAFWDPFDPASGFVAVPGEFRVRLYPAQSEPATTTGTANCKGVVTA